MQSSALLETYMLVDQIVLLLIPQETSSLLFFKSLLWSSGACISTAEHRYIGKDTELPIISLQLKSRYRSCTEGWMA